MNPGENPNILRLPARRKPFATVKVRNVAVPVYAYADGRFIVPSRKDGRRLREQFRDLDKAKSHARQIAVKIANGQAWTAGLTAADAARLASRDELAISHGRRPEELDADISAALQLLPPGRTLAEAAAHLKAELAASAPVERSCAEVAAEFLEERGRAGVNADWLRNLRSQLKKFTAFFRCPVSSVNSADINRFLDFAGGNERTRKNYRATLVAIARFAQSRRYLLKDWNELDRNAVPVPRTLDKDIRIFSGEDFARLLTVAQSREPKLVPFLAITAFAGVRFKELSRLDWSEVDFAGSMIYIRAAKAKKRVARAVPMPENLRALLWPCRRDSGAVVELRDISNALCRAKRLAGIPAGRNETRNILRQSFISYLKAATGDVARVADVAGNSPAMIRKHYLKVIHPKEAEAWFGIDGQRREQMALFKIEAVLPAIASRLARTIASEDYGPVTADHLQPELPNFLSQTVTA